MTPTTETTNKMRRRHMWFSFETASAIYDWANIVLIGALVIGVFATAVVVYMGTIKEGHLRRDIASANERAANANERAATAVTEGKRIESESKERISKVEAESSRKIGEGLATKASEELIDFLKSYKWSAHIFPKIPKEQRQIPAGSIKICVGFKPSPYFMPQFVKDLLKESEQKMEEMRRKSKQMDKENEDLLRQIQESTPEWPKQD